MEKPGHQPGPAGLVTGPQAGPVIAVEVLVEEDVVAPIRVGLEFFRSAVYGAAALCLVISQKFELRAPLN